MSVRASLRWASTADAHRLRVDRGKVHALVRERLDSLDSLELVCGVTCMKILAGVLVKFAIKFMIIY